MSRPWWESWSVEELSPLNPEAVVAAQLDPPEMREVWVRGTSGQFIQIWWLCWHARPDVRELLMEDWPMPISLRAPVIHPETIAEWAEPPRWQNTGSQQREWSIRRAALRFIPLTVDQSRLIYPPTWDVVSVAFQAGQSVEHGALLIPLLRNLSQSDKRN